MGRRFRRRGAAPLVALLGVIVLGAAGWTQPDQPGGTAGDAACPGVWARLGSYLRLGDWCDQLERQAEIYLRGQAGAPRSR